MDGAKYYRNKTSVQLVPAYQIKRVWLMLITIPVARFPLLFRIDYISLVWIINWAVFPTRQYKFQPTLCLQRIKELFQ